MISYSLTKYWPVSDLGVWHIKNFADPPPTILKPQNASALPGNSALMTCQAHSTVEFNLTWYRAKDNLNLRALQRARIFRNGSVEMRYQLPFTTSVHRICNTRWSVKCQCAGCHNCSDVEKDDEGEYICRAENEGGYTEERLFLIVQSRTFLLHCYFIILYCCVVWCRNNCQISGYSGTPCAKSLFSFHGLAWMTLLF